MRTSADLPQGTRRLAVLLAATLVASACGSIVPPGGTPAAPTSSPSPSPLTSASPTPPPQGSPTAAPTAPPTAWDVALDRIGPEGQFDFQSALDLFATAFGPIPGSNAQQDTTGITDRTVALSAVMGHATELTADQRAAIDNYLKPDPDATHIKIPPAAKALTEVRAAAVSDSQKAELYNLVTAQRKFIADQVHFDFDGDLDIAYKPQPAGQPNLLAYAWSDWPGGNFGQCQINVVDNTFTGDPKLVDAVLAHELFHCFQFSYYGTQAAFFAAPKWVTEGQAAWVGELVGGPSGVTSHWTKYLTIPFKSLTTRVYDAIGFYSHLAETGTDPWSIFQAQWDAGGNNVAAYEAADAHNDGFEGSWASSVMRQPGRGTEWDTTGPDIPGSDVAYKPNFSDVVDGSQVDLSAPFFTNEVRYLTVDADMLHVQVEGHGRLSDGNLNTTSLADVWFCVEGHKCEKPCPEAPDPPESSGDITNFVAIASSGGLDGTIGTATGMDLQKDCETPTATDDQFCTKYRDYVNWAKQQGGGDTITRAQAAEIVNRFTDMRPVAPAELLADVDLFIKIYNLYATSPNELQLPTLGPEAAGIGPALIQMNAYCHVTF